MTQIEADQNLLQKLGGLTSPVELCDADGQVLGHCLPAAECQKMLHASNEILLSDEELARRRAETGGSTLPEIWKELGHA